MNFDISNAYTSNMDGVHQLIANLANVENEVDKEILEENNGQTSNLNNPNTLSIELMNEQLPEYSPEVNAF